MYAIYYFPCLLVLLCILKDPWLGNVINCNYVPDALTMPPKAACELWKRSSPTPKGAYGSYMWMTGSSTISLPSVLGFAALFKMFFVRRGEVFVCLFIMSTIKNLLSVRVRSLIFTSCVSLQSRECIFLSITSLDMLTEPESFIITDDDPENCITLKVSIIP